MTPTSTDAPRAHCAAEWHVLADPDHFWMRWRLASALAQFRDLGFPLTAPWRVLDVGCGRGVLDAQLEGATSWTVDGVDLDRAAIDAAAPGRGAHTVRDLLAEPRAGATAGDYDAAILYDVLEHLADPVALAAAARRELRRGGVLLVNVPALPRYTSGYDRVVGHLRRYDRATLAATLEAAGYRVQDVRYWGLALVPALIVRKRMVDRLEKRPDADAVIVARGFAEPPRLVVELLDLARAAELAIFSRPPIGSSLLAVARNP